MLKRSRMTVARLSRISPRLPPDSRWICRADTKIRTSGSGIRNVRFNRASRNGRPRFCWRYVMRNSWASGSGISSPMSENAVVNACPARTARASRSIESGNSSSKRLKRRCLLKATTMNGVLAARMETRRPARNVPSRMMAPIHEASNSEIEINRKTPTCISTAACCKNSWSRGIIGAAASTRFTNGLSLSSSRRKSSISKAASDSSVVVCTAARRTLSFCFASGTWTKKYAALTNSPKLTMKINIVRTCRNICTLQLCINSGFRTSHVSLPLRFGEERIDVERNAGSNQLLAELRPDAGRPEPSLHLSIGIDSLAVENKQVLNRDHRPFHAGHLGDAHHFSRAIRQTVDLHNDVDG